MVVTHAREKINVEGHLVQQIRWGKSDGHTDTTDRSTVVAPPATTSVKKASWPKGTETFSSFNELIRTACW